MLAGFQFNDPETDTGNGTLFQCSVNVGRVTNALVPQHHIDDRVAFIAAGAIGLDGYTDDPQQWLYQRYFLGSVYIHSITLISFVANLGFKYTELPSDGELMEIPIKWLSFSDVLLLEFLPRWILIIPRLKLLE